MGLLPIIQRAKEAQEVPKEGSLPEIKSPAQLLDMIIEVTYEARAFDESWFLMERSVHEKWRGEINEKIMHINWELGVRIMDTIPKTY